MPAPRPAANGRRFFNGATTLLLSALVVLVVTLSHTAYSDMIPSRMSNAIAQQRRHHEVLAARDAYTIQRAPSGLGVGPRITNLTRPAGANAVSLTLPNINQGEVFAWYSKTP